MTVTREEYEALAARVNALEAVLNEMLRPEEQDPSRASHETFVERVRARDAARGGGR